MTTIRNTITLSALALSSAIAAQAAGHERFATVSRAAAERQIAGVLQQTTPAAMWVWTDKYVYQPNETVNVRWTLKSNSDFYPYTVVAYRQHNRTGNRAYLPGGSGEPTDVYGSALSAGFRIVRLESVNKAVLAGSLSIPANELGMHTIVVQLRDYSGGRVIKSAYWKFGVVDGTETVSGEITSNRELVSTKAYNLSGVVYVRNNATLTIQPGTFIIGQPGSQPPSTLVITKSGKIDARGTRSSPIIMTSSRPIGQRQRGDWGGLIMLGQAPTNLPAGESFIEGLARNDDTQYGGADANHSCGTLRYVRVEFAGVALSANNETNGITWGGCGRGTVSEYLQVLYGNDDSFEWFGGNSDAKYLVAAYSEDDNLDFQMGWTGRIQHAVILQNADRGNRGIEGDNNEFNFTATPNSRPVMYNITMVGSGQPGSSEANSPGFFLRRGAAGSFNNMIVTNFSSVAAQFTDAPTLTNIDNNSLAVNGLLLWNNGIGTTAANTVEAQVHTDIRTFLQGQRGQGRNVMVADPRLARPFEYSNPDFRPAEGSPAFRANWVQPPDDGFFDQWATWIGAFGEHDWTEEWTNFLQEQDIRP